MNRILIIGKMFSQVREKFEEICLGYSTEEILKKTTSWGGNELILKNGQTIIATTSFDNIRGLRVNYLYMPMDMSVGEIGKIYTYFNMSRIGDFDVDFY